MLTVTLFLYFLLVPPRLSDQNITTIGCKWKAGSTHNSCTFEIQSKPMANDVITDMSNSNLSSEVVKTKVINKNEPNYTQSITIYIDEVS